MATPPDAEPRTLAQWLGQMSDEALAGLFRARPDLVQHLPEDLTTLASRCASPVSLRLVWHRLTALEQQVIEVLIAHQVAVPLPDLLAAMDPVGTGAADAIVQAVRRCEGLALIWGGDAALRTLTAASALVGPDACGLDATDRSHLPRISRYLSDPESFLGELAIGPAGARAALDRLMWGPPRGTMPNAERAVSAASATTALEWLLARDMLVPVGPDSVVLPRELALLLRNGRYVPAVALPPGPPTVPGAKAIPDADATAGMHALAFTRHVGRLLALFDEGRTRVLRSGGIYQRDAGELAGRLQLTVAETALVADVTHGAELIAADQDSGLWGLTRTADAWLALSEPRRWAALALAWRDSATHAPLAAPKGTDNRILSDGLHAPSIWEIRRLTLELAAAQAGGAPIDVERMVAAIGWSRPRLQGRDLPEFIAEILSDGEFLGVFGRGALSRAGRLLASVDSTPANIAAAVPWPALVERVVLQADQTATALGPITPEAESRVSLLADLESSGAGTVYRISATSLQRAFDAGMATAEVLAELADLSLTPVPASLESLVHDVGRRYGAIRVQATACVVTADDDAALAAALADRSLTHLRLHRIAAGIAISPQGAEQVTAALRKAGIAAVSAAAARPTRRRRLPARSPVFTERADPAQLAAAVRAVRAGESARRVLTGPEKVAPVGPHDLVDALMAAIIEHRNVWLDYSDPSGSRKVRLVEPLTLRAGLLSGFDHRELRVVAFPLSRIAGISVVAAPD